MTDGIDGVAGANGALTPKKAQQAHGKVERVNASDGTRGGSDVVSLSGGAEALDTLKKEVGGTAPVDRQKVDAIKQALAAGEYELDADRVAQKFLEIEQALGKL